MMTPQEVANCTFAKSMVGGYNMASVDDFLDRLTEDYSALYKENTALKAKLKMTVDKMAEYKESEDAIRSTLLAAQKMSTAMISEAEQKRDALIGNATSAAKNRIAELQQQIAEAEHKLESVRFQVDKERETKRKRLVLGQEQLRAFIREVRAVCNEELAQLELLPDLPMEEQTPAVQIAPPPTVQPKAAEEPKPLPEPEEEIDEEAQELQRNLAQAMSAFAPAPDVPVSRPAPKSVKPPQPPVEVKPPMADPFAEDELEDASDTRVLNLDDLQFGPNYTKD